MIENIVIDCSPLTNSLRVCRIGAKNTVLEQENRENEILGAVRDFLVEKAKQNNSKTFGYEWNRRDGAIVELSIKIKEKDE